MTRCTRLPARRLPLLARSSSSDPDQTPVDWLERSGAVRSQPGASDTRNQRLPKPANATPEAAPRAQEWPVSSLSRRFLSALWPRTPRAAGWRRAPASKRGGSRRRRGRDSKHWRTVASGARLAATPRPLPRARLHGRRLRARLATRDDAAAEGKAVARDAAAPETPRARGASETRKPRRRPGARRADPRDAPPARRDQQGRPDAVPAAAARELPARDRPRGPDLRLRGAGPAPLLAQRSAAGAARDVPRRALRRRRVERAPRVRRPRRRRRDRGRARGPVPGRDAGERRRPRGQGGARRVGEVARGDELDPARKEPVVDARFERTKPPGQITGAVRCTTYSSRNAPGGCERTETGQT